MTAPVKNIRDYFSLFPPHIQSRLEEIHRIIASEAPQATEAMKYGIPTFVFMENLVHYAAYESHIGFYPTPSAIKAFKSRLKTYKNSKGAVQFPLDDPLPEQLIREMVRFRLDEVRQKFSIQ